MKTAAKRTFEKARTAMDKLQEDQKRQDDKATPGKENMAENTGVQQVLSPNPVVLHSNFGSPLWCATGTQCKNHHADASDDYRCFACKLFAHQECTTIDNEGRTVCNICKEIATYDEIMQLEDSVIHNQEGNESNYLHIEGDDPTTSSTETNVATNTSTTDEIPLNVSGSTTMEDKTDIMEFIVKQGITKRSEDKYIHIIANMAGVAINFDKLNEKALEKYIQDIKVVMGSKAFDKKCLYGNRYKIFAQLMSVNIPRGNHSRKVRENLIKAGYDKLESINAALIKNNPMLQEMPKITGAYLRNNSMDSEHKEEILTNVVKVLSTMKPESVKINSQALAILQTLRATHGRRKVQYGEDQWCALGTECKNKTIPAPAQLKCLLCHKSVHQLCGKGDSFQSFECFACINKKTSQSSYTKPKQPSNAPSENQTKEVRINETTRSAPSINTPPAQPQPLSMTSQSTEKTASKNATYENPSTVARNFMTPQDPRLNIQELDDNMSEESEQPTLQTRFDIRINVRSRNEGAEFQDLLDEVVEFIKQLKHADPSVQVVPWLSKNGDASVAFDLERLPNTIQELNRFFPRLRVQAGTTWGDVMLLHKVEYYDIITLCEVWLDNRGHGFYYKRLQCVAAAPVGWLLWSFRAIDTRVLAEKIEELYKIKVEFRYSAIAVDRSIQPLANQIRALHIWIPDDAKFRRTKRILQEIYKSGIESYPLDIRLRLVPMYNRCGGQQRLAKIKKLRSRQGAFLRAITYTNCRTWEIVNLDEPTGGLPALRRLIMGERAKDDSGPLFLSVDCLYKRNDVVVFSFLPRNDNEARIFVSNLAAHMILKHQSNPAIYEYFTPEACGRSEEVEWDPVNQQVITADDRYLDDLSLDDDFMDFDEDPNEQVVTPIPTSRIENLFLGRTDDSVGTLRTIQSQPQQKRKKQAPGTPNKTTTISPGSADTPRTPK